jgi:hypothetical protein
VELLIFCNVDADFFTRPRCEHISSYSTRVLFDPPKPSRNTTQESSVFMNSVP